jgi:hypothetical protein
MLSSSFCPPGKRKLLTGKKKKKESPNGSIGLK